MIINIKALFSIPFFYDKHTDKYSDSGLGLILPLYPAYNADAE